MIASALPGLPATVTTQQLTFTISWTQRELTNGTWQQTSHEMDVTAAVTDTSGFGADLVVDGKKASPAASTHLAILAAAGGTNFQFRIPPGAAPPPGTRMTNVAAPTTPIEALLPKSAARESAATGILHADDKITDQNELPGTTVHVHHGDTSTVRMSGPITPTDWAPTWEPAANLAKVTKAVEYLAAHGIPTGAPAAKTATVKRPKKGTSTRTS
jgi:hypothetical protein